MISNPYRSLVPLILTLAFLIGSCAPSQEIPPPPDSPSPEQATNSALREEAAVQGPSCPESFQEQDEVREQSQIAPGGRIKLTLGRTPSIPCSWDALQIHPPSAIEQIDRQTKWPADGSTPQPGAPGMLIYQLRAVEVEKATLTLPCSCLGEEGTESQLEGTYLLSITIGEK